MGTRPAGAVAQGGSRQAAKNRFEEGKLPEDSVVKDSLTTAADGKRYKKKLYHLDGPGSVGHEEMKTLANERYDDFDAKRRRQEALAADAEDLKAVPARAPPHNPNAV